MPVSIIILLKIEFRRINIPFTQKYLHRTIKQKRFFPQYKSHSLGNICKDLGIDIDNRHRAFGDAAASAIY